MSRVLFIILINSILIQWGRMPDSPQVSNNGAHSNVTLPIAYTSWCSSVINGGNDGGTSWANIAGYVETFTELKVNAWINGTGRLVNLNYICIGI
jgi:hypothetical protein